MKRTILALAAGVSLVGSGLALAQNKPPEEMGQPKGMQPGQQKMEGATREERMVGRLEVEPNKHLAEVDVYLTDAMNNIKVLYQIAEMPPGKLDPSIQKEGIQNIDKALNSALTHISHLKSLPEAKVADVTKLDGLQRELTRARSQLSALRRTMGTANRTEFAAGASQIYATLKTADDEFNQIAQVQKLVRVDRIEVPERQPVGGTVEEGKGMKPEHKMQPPPGGAGTEGGGTQPGGGTPPQGGGGGY